jgi:hypothetical protein
MKRDLSKAIEPKKIQLTKETIRNLQAEDLPRVIGGQHKATPNSCGPC